MVASPTGRMPSCNSVEPNKSVRATSFQEDCSSESSVNSKQSSRLSRTSNKEEFDRNVLQIERLPKELLRLVDVFIDDLKQPKYLKPLSIFQLSGLFQEFYVSFDMTCVQLLNGEMNSGGSLSPVNYDNLPFSAKNSLSAGFSGIFNKSRSGSVVKLKKQQSINQDSDIAVNSQPPVSPDELERSSRQKELTNLKIERYMELCERDIFQKIQEVGTSVLGSSRNGSINRSLQILELFRNSPEFIEYDSILTTKILDLQHLAQRNELNLAEFLGMPDSINFNSELLGGYLRVLVEDRISPFEKMMQLLDMHDSMTELGNATSNDDYLPMLLYVIIMNPINTLYLNILFIRLFRYHKKLVANEQYVVTNMTAAMCFLENLTYEDLPDSVKKHTSPGLLFKLSDRIKIPEIKMKGKPDLPRVHSKSTVGFSLDTSLRYIYGRLKSYTPPASYNNSANGNNGNPHQKPTSPKRGQHDCHNQGRAQYELPPPARNSSHNSPSIEDSCNHRLAIPESWKKYRNRNFDDLTLSEMRLVFSTYQKLLQTLEP
ncbi:HDR058Cp [Eremothecium sinecaudum]|uniref:HDR058Cp n=1 Tax=Eremothecium sinecaudum TaxID=45286 RepID=A0A0X8HSS1_9SACH|nr:HDR058Cp [Eremothecium sinecaudum]AMD20800.1 HDR058Cp [Eremothecium sinecaudum]